MREREMVLVLAVVHGSRFLPGVMGDR